MKRSDFLKRLAGAALRVVHEYNREEADKKVFDWEYHSLCHSKVANIYAAASHGEKANPITLAIRHVALNRMGDGNLDLDTLVLLEAAWEYYETNFRG